MTIRQMTLAEVAEYANNHANRVFLRMQEGKPPLEPHEVHIILDLIRTELIDLSARNPNVK